MIHDIAKEIEKLADDLGIDRKRSIGEVAKELKVETHIIRFWEEKFPQIKPEIGEGKRRYYYNKQLKILKRIKKFLYEDGYTVSGLQKLLKQRKQDNYKEEDLDIIISSEENNDKATLDNFIDPSLPVKVNQASSSFDKKTIIELDKSLMRVKQNLDRLKTLLHKSIL
ncbi:MAG: MerR family transcriptional regulator [Rickettsiales bacterium]|nr:MerR family transcriptional regulator [Rickettsiales bacterium]